MNGTGREDTYILMCADKEVGRIGKDTGYIWSFTNKHLIPKGLNIHDNGSLIKDEEFCYMYPRFTSWLTDRTLSLSRSNVKALLKLFRFEQSESQETKVKIALTFRGINLIDSFWVKNISENVKWSEVNLRVNPLAETVSQVALTGKMMTAQFKDLNRTAEMMTLGMTSKGWFREEDGLYLHKTDAAGYEVLNEICASKVIDCFNVYGNLKYELSDKCGKRTSRCKLMATEEKSVVHAHEIRLWCKYNNIDFTDFVLGKYLKEYSQMAVIDYLTANSDRHEWNWGFYQDVQTGELLGLHELYDHNQTFNEDYTENENLESMLAPDFTQKQMALKYIASSGLKITAVPAVEMFPNERAYSVFVERCKQLSLME